MASQTSAMLDAACLIVVVVVVVVVLFVRLEVGGGEEGTRVDSERSA